MFGRSTGSNRRQHRQVECDASESNCCSELQTADDYESFQVEMSGRSTGNSMCLRLRHAHVVRQDAVSLLPKTIPLQCRTCTYVGPYYRQRLQMMAVLTMAMAMHKSHHNNATSVIAQREAQQCERVYTAVAAASIIDVVAVQKTLSNNNNLCAQWTTFGTTTRVKVNLEI